MACSSADRAQTEAKIRELEVQLAYEREEKAEAEQDMFHTAEVSEFLLAQNENTRHRLQQACLAFHTEEDRVATELAEQREVMRSEALQLQEQSDALESETTLRPLSRTGSLPGSRRGSLAGPGSRHSSRRGSLLGSRPGSRRQSMLHGERDLQDDENSDAERSSLVSPISFYGSSHAFNGTRDMDDDYQDLLRKHSSLEEDHRLLELQLDALRHDGSVARTRSPETSRNMNADECLVVSQRLSCSSQIGDAPDLTLQSLQGQLGLQDEYARDLEGRLLQSIADKGRLEFELSEVAEQSEELVCSATELESIAQAERLETQESRVACEQACEREAEQLRALEQEWRRMRPSHLGPKNTVHDDASAPGTPRTPRTLLAKSPRRPSLAAELEAAPASARSSSSATVKGIGTTAGPEPPESLRMGFEGSPDHHTAHTAEMALHGRRESELQALETHCQELKARHEEMEQRASQAQAQSLHKQESHYSGASPSDEQFNKPRSEHSESMSLLSRGTASCQPDVCDELALAVCVDVPLPGAGQTTQKPGGPDAAGGEGVLSKFRLAAAGSASSPRRRATSGSPVFGKTRSLARPPVPMLSREAMDKAAHARQVHMVNRSAEALPEGFAPSTVEPPPQQCWLWNACVCSRPKAWFG